MNGKMVHWDPDDVGILIGEGSSFRLECGTAEHHRPREGHQPLANRDGNVWAVLTGEMCNQPGAVGMTT